MFAQTTFTHFMSLAFFYNPIKHNKIIGMKRFNVCRKIRLFFYKVFWCFQEVEKGCIGNEWVQQGTTNLITRKKKSLIFRQTLKWRQSYTNNKTYIIVLNTYIISAWGCHKNPCSNQGRYVLLNHSDDILLW